MHDLHPSTLIVGCLALVLLAGCGGENDDLPPLPETRTAYFTITFESTAAAEDAEPTLLQAADPTAAFRRKPQKSGRAGKPVWTVEINVPIETSQQELRERLEEVDGVTKVEETGA